jgi:hypothetical protein
METAPQKLILDVPLEERADQPLEMASGRCPSRGGRGGGKWGRVIAEIENLTSGMFLSLKEVTR